MHELRLLAHVALAPSRWHVRNLFRNAGQDHFYRLGGAPLRTESCPIEIVENHSPCSTTERVRVQDCLIRFAPDCTQTAALSYDHADCRSRRTGRSGWAGWTSLALFNLRRLTVAASGKKQAKKSQLQNGPHAPAASGLAGQGGRLDQ